MKPPSLTVDKMKIVYKQVPYDDRYYFVAIGTYTPGLVEIAKIPHGHVKLVWALFEAHLSDQLTGAMVSRWDRFQERVDVYNKWLDDQEA